MTEEPSSAEEDSRIPVRFEYTPTFPQILAHLKASLLVTTYQAGKVLVLGVQDEKLAISFMSLEQPMGLAVSASRIAIGSRRQMHFLVPAHETQSGDSPHDGCFVPRSSIYSGAIHGHDLAWGEGGLWAVNTLFSCLSTLHPNFSFVPQWRPPFITQLIDQDRCHLNGLAMEAGRPKYVTVLGQSDDPAGWRPGKVDGGTILEVPSGRVLCQGLSMPHSPRKGQDRLYVLNSGEGQLCQVDERTGRINTIESLPGYTRGLALGGQFAFVGLSKIRETNIFGGLPIGQQPDQLRCGVGVVDLISGRTVATFQFHSGVEEIFAVELLPGFVNPLLAGSALDERQQEVWIVPHEQMPRPPIISEAPIFADEKLLSSDHNLPTDAASVQQLVSSAAGLRSAGKLEESAQCLSRAASLSDNAAALLIDLGNLRQEQGQQHAARLCYERALEHDPESIPAQQNLGYLAFNLGMTDEAAEVLDRLVAAHPSPINQLLSASVLPVVYDSIEDIDHWQTRSLNILRNAVKRGDRLDATQSLVPTFFFSAYTGNDPREMIELRGQIVHGKDFTRGRPAWTRDSGRPLRVGFLSAYFRDHTIGRLNIGRVESTRELNAHRLVIQVGRASDWLSDRFKQSADQYVELPRELTAATDALDELDLDLLLFTDIGMDSLTTTLTFSRFAPVQAASWGHPLTSGSPMIDYFLSSPDLEIAAGQSHYTEKLLLLESLGLCYQRPMLPNYEGQKNRAQHRQDLKLSADKHLYGCPQTLFKFHPDFDTVLAGILEADAKAELILIEGRVSRWTNDLMRRFRRTLPEAGRRVRFLPSMPNENFLKLLAACDVLLDPFPFGGGNTTLEGLAMNTPIVTLPSDFLSGRITSALLKRLGLESCIAGNGEEYVRLALEIANDVSRRSEVADMISGRSTVLFDQPHAAQAWLQEILRLLGSLA